jgi:predicted NAD/FAD-binding protein
MMKIAIIGSGISGAACAHYLDKKGHDISIIEANDYLGGHTHTHKINHLQKTYKVDTGFIVFNKRTYPNFLKMIESLNVAYKETSMSFSVSCEKTGLEYNGTNFNTLFAQRSNLLRPSFYGFLKGIVDFNKKASRFLKESNHQMTLGQFFKKFNIRKDVLEYYIVPMIAAVWSVDPVLVWEFPAVFILRFFENHGFLEVEGRPQWYVIEGGSRSYLEAILSQFKGKIYSHTPVQGIRRADNKAYVMTEGKEEEYDAVIIATHSDTALKLLKDPSHDERDVLEALPYSNNPTFLHTDKNFLPKRKLAWASWNYLLPQDKSHGSTVTYNMNILQGHDCQDEFLVTLNPHKKIDPTTIIKEMNYSHPLFTLEGMDAQAKWDRISGVKNTFYCGAYWRNGFHEDGLFSALRVVEQIEGK